MMYRLAKCFVLHTAGDKIIELHGIKLDIKLTTHMAVCYRSNFQIAILLQSNLLTSLAEFM